MGIKSSKKDVVISTERYLIGALSNWQWGFLPLFLWGQF